METKIKINTKEIDGIMIFEFNGELDETNTDDTFANLYEQIGNFNEAKIILNFKNLIYLNSKSIGYIADIILRLEEKNGLIFISEGLKDILNLVGIADMIHITDTDEEAINKIKESK